MPTGVEGVTVDGRHLTARFLCHACTRGLCAPLAVTDAEQPWLSITVNANAYSREPFRVARLYRLTTSTSCETCGASPTERLWDGWVHQFEAAAIVGGGGVDSVTAITSPFDSFPVESVRAVAA